MSIIHELIENKITSILNENDIQIIKNFLEIKGRTGYRIKRCFKSNLYQFFIFLKRNNLLSIDVNDCEKYIKYIDKQALKYSSKKTKRSNINSFFKYYERIIRRSHPTYYNPVPTLDECNFSVDNSLSIQEQEKKQQDSIYSITQLKEIILYSKYKNEKSFIVSLLMIFCGMRISECTSIQIKNIDLEKRYLMTGIEENARKSNKRGNHPLYFCFPKIVASILKEYILRLQISKPNSIWLLPGSKGKHISESSYQLFLKDSFTFTAKSHSFRRSIETFQLNSNNNAPLHIVEILSNHVISSVVMKHYNKISINERREFYDQYLPKEYNDILFFLKKF